MTKNIITVTGYKGGVAKSTTAIHLADFLSDYGSSLLIDSDPNRTALSRFNSNLQHHRQKFPFKVVSQLEAMKYVADFEFIIFDTPARPHTNDLEELALSCDLLILPTQPNVDSFEPMMQTALDLGSSPYKFLLTIVPPHPNKDGLEAQQELIAAGLPVFSQMIRRSTGFQKAAKAHTTVRYLAGMGSLWHDYRTVGKEVLEFLNHNAVANNPVSSGVSH